MNLAALSSVLLFALSIPIVMQYRILPIEGTPYWLFGILFALLTINILKPKSYLLWVILTIVLGGTTWTTIVDRSKTAPVYGVHDIILQQEAAMRYFLEGKNPYKETYFGTPLEEFHYAEIGNPDAINPALYHFVMPPWYLLFPFPIYAISIPLLGYFDGRMALLVAMAGLLIVLGRWFKDKSLATLAVILTALSPATVDYFIEGRSDVFALFWFVWSLYLLEKKKFFWSSIIFALAVASKQTIWFAVPFYFLSTKRKYFFASVLAATAIVAPFLVWDAQAFINSTVRYLQGTTSYGYPVSGYGLGMVLYELGFIKNLHAYYPFILWQIIFALPVAIFAIRWFLKKPTSSRLLLGYAFTLLVFWYMSRYFNNSHLGYLSSVFVLGILKEQDDV